MVSRGGETIQTGHYTNDQGTVAGFDSTTGAKGVGYHGADNSGGVVKTQDGDVYAGRDGNVYKKTDDGGSKYDDGGWTPVDPSHNVKTSSSQVNSTQTQSRQVTQPDSTDRQSHFQSSTTPNTSSFQGGGGNWDSTRDQLDRDSSARNTGEGGAQDYSSWRDRFSSSAGERQGSGLFGGERQGADAFSDERPRFGVGRGGGGGWGRR